MPASFAAPAWIGWKRLQVDRTTADQAVADAIASAKKLRNEARVQARLVVAAAEAEAAQIHRTAQLEGIAKLAGEGEKALARPLDQLPRELSALSEWTAGAGGRTDSETTVELAPGVPPQLVNLGRSIAYWTLVVAVSLALVVALILFFESRDVSSLEP